MARRSAAIAFIPSTQEQSNSIRDGPAPVKPEPPCGPVPITAIWSEWSGVMCSFTLSNTLHRNNSNDIKKIRKEKEHPNIIFNNSRHVFSVFFLLFLTSSVLSKYFFSYTYIYTFLFFFFLTIFMFCILKESLFSHLEGAIKIINLSNRYNIRRKTL